MRHDLVGQRFGKLTVVAEISDNYWECSCDCGNITKLNSCYLVTGKTKSCGCYRMDVLLARNITHGMSDTKQFRRWQGMIKRCTNKNTKEFNSYGGRGIRVCDRWMNSFEAFHEDMGFPPTDDHSLDRIDNDGNYEPSNCRWATHDEQAKNTSANRYYTHDGRTMTMTDWTRETGITDSALRYRMDLRGMSFADAITMPMHGPRTITCDGKTLTISEWEAISGISARTIRSRIFKQGWDVERALTTPTK